MVLVSSKKALFLSIMVIVAILGSSVFTVFRTEGVGRQLELINRFYLPALKHLNVIEGKWSTYKKSVDQYVQFNRWGEKNLELGHPRLYFRRSIDSNVSELNKIALINISETSDLDELRDLLSELTQLADREPGQLAELAALVKVRHLEEAAQLYMRVRQGHGSLSHRVSMTVRDLEAHMSQLQLQAERESHETAAIMIILLALSLATTLLAVLRMRRWLLPLIEWRQAIAQLARHVATSGFQGMRQTVQMPQVTRGTPPEMVLLTREFSHMATTAMEHERTIQQQKTKLENLNDHLKNQNETFRKLGSLNERILNAMSAGVIVLDAQGFAEQFNSRFCELFSVDRSAVLGKRLDELTPEFGNEAIEHWQSCSDVLNLARVITRKDRVFTVRVQMLGTGRVISLEDITAQVAAENRLAHAEKLMLAGNMSAQVAHEIRNPLNSMMLQLEMLQDDLMVTGAPHNPQMARSLVRVGQISTQVERLERVTKSYLDVQKGVTRSAGLAADPQLPDLPELAVSRPVAVTSGATLVDIHDLLEQTVDFCSGEIQARGVLIELKFEAKSSTVHVSLGDADRLTQVFLNLLQNALDASEMVALERRRITISTRTLAASRDHAAGASGNHLLIVTISDEGPGVSRQVQGRLFEPFVTSKAQGHGLGLSMARQVCLELGGDLKLVENSDSIANGHHESLAPSSGACFQVSLPC